MQIQIPHRHSPVLEAFDRTADAAGNPPEPPSRWAGGLCADAMLHVPVGLQVELAAFGAVDKRHPLGLGENEDRAIRVLGVPDPDFAAVTATHLDTVAAGTWCRLVSDSDTGTLVTMRRLNIFTVDRTKTHVVSSSPIIQS
jgi:hypothetical protein